MGIELCTEQYFYNKTATLCKFDYLSGQNGPYADEISFRLVNRS